MFGAKFQRVCALDRHGGRLAPEGSVERFARRASRENEKTPAFSRADGSARFGDGILTWPGARGTRTMPGLGMTSDMSDDGHERYNGRLTGPRRAR
jgi:hypothetical protein